HLALHELPGHVAQPCFSKVRALVQASWRKWLVAV
ncbi:hypothetical protein, partial [Salmonella enterica]